MMDAAADLSGFEGYRKNFVLTYTYKQPDLDVLKGKDSRGGILSSLYFWRRNKASLLHGILFYKELY